MSHQETIHDPAAAMPPSAGPAASAEPGAAAIQDPYAYEQRDGWAEEATELPPRPRRRLLTPVPLALAAVLLTACGFIGGVLVEKGEGSPSSSSGSSAGLASRFAALRSASAGATSGGSAAGAARFAGGAGRPTAGTVAYLDGKTLYVTNAEGNTVRVETSPATSVTKSVKGEVSAIHPGETVTVSGPTSSDGAVTAEAITVGSAGGGLAALFGGGGAARSTGAPSVSSLFGG